MKDEIGMWRGEIFLTLITLLTCSSLWASDSIAFKKAYNLYSVGQHIESKNILTDLEKAKTQYAPVYYYLALITQEENNFADAEAYFQKSIEIDPSFAPAYSDFSILKYQQKQYDQAKEAAKKAIVLDPKFVKAYINLSSIFYKLGDLKAAKAYVSEAAKLDVTQIVNLGDMFLKKYLNAEMALFYYDAVLDVSPQQLLALIGKGNCHRMRGEYEAAYEVLKKAYEETPRENESFDICYDSFFSFLFETKAYHSICSKVFERVEKDYIQGYFYYALASYKLNLSKEFKLSASMYFELQNIKMPEALEYWAEEQFNNEI